MSDIEFCPDCGSPVVGSDTGQMCTGCGLTYHEMIDLLDEDELQEDDEIDPDDGTDDEYGGDFEEGTEEFDSDW